MIKDYYNEMSDKQALTATAVSTDVIDLDNDNNIGKGIPMAVAVVASVAADFTTGDETYKFTVQTSADNLSFTTVTESGAILGSALTAGEKVVLPLGFSNSRYLRMNYTLAGTSPSITVDANLVPLADIGSFEALPSGYTV